MDRAREIEILAKADEAKARAIALMQSDAVRDVLRKHAEQARALRAARSIEKARSFG